MKLISGLIFTEDSFVISHLMVSSLLLTHLAFKMPMTFGCSYLTHSVAQSHAPV